MVPKKWTSGGIVQHILAKDTKSLILSQELLLKRIDSLDLATNITFNKFIKNETLFRTRSVEYCIPDRIKESGLDAIAIRSVWILSLIHI